MENPVSRKQAAALKKKEIKRAKDKDYYEKNRNKKIAQVIERRKARREETKGKSRTRTEIKKAASKKRRKEQRATAREELERKRQIAREKTRERVRRYRQKNKEEQGQEKKNLQNTGERFKNRTSKKRVTDKVKDKLPQTPEKKSRSTRNFDKQPENKKNTFQAREQPALEHDTASHMADLAACGSTVAIEAEGDRMYDFYLLKVTSAGVEELEHDYTDDYHNTALRGESVLKGHFYLRDNIHDMTFTLNEKRIAVVYAATVRHICGDLPTKKRGKKLIYKLPLKENEAILAIL
ncbi:predicted protein [Nematostella vectensis]|uniref:Uncharacterized protein n=1 Tax=Nematostella vectensis TaxID=45351 RepID=A7SV05_NEMVE|nr:predicted protein [Nematostella vectensis]|eukprot:XP_001624554.1 predicted protein [Nematostella vectensis]